MAWAVARFIFERGERGSAHHGLRSNVGIVSLANEVGETMTVNIARIRHRPMCRHAAYVAFVVHRLSGLALALFLPVHFWALGRALNADAELEGFLRWTDTPSVKAAEWVLVLLLAVHAGGGIRLLALEFLPWRDWQRMLLAFAAAFSIAVGLAFALAL